MKTLRILIADDHEVVRRGVRSLLEEHDGWEVCGEAGDGRDAVTMAAEFQPDVVVLDIGMPNMNGLEAARQILHGAPATMVLVLTMDESEQSTREALRAGVRGILLKSDAARDLVLAIEAVRDHRSFFTAGVAEMVLNAYMGREMPRPASTLRDPLTRREREVVQLLAEGKSTKEVAIVLGLSVKTAETHRANVMRKLNLHSVSQLVLYAVRNNIVQVLPIVASPAIAQCIA
jgi:DNA-binding NarL/FixJ family response regulator